MRGCELKIAQQTDQAKTTINILILPKERRTTSANASANVQTPHPRPGPNREGVALVTMTVQSPLVEPYGTFHPYEYLTMLIESVPRDPQNHPVRSGKSCVVHVRLVVEHSKIIACARNSLRLLKRADGRGCHTAVEKTLCHLVRARRSSTSLKRTHDAVGRLLNYTESEREKLKKK